MKYKSTFFRAPTLDRMRRNAEGTALKASVLKNAEPWNRQSCDELWAAVFGPELPRSHMVLSYGWCPSCKQITDKYGWRVDPFARDWKVACPACTERFPTNDFGAYYRSGLDAHGVFRMRLADRSLLFNAAHPDPKDPLHLFGVDDGTGWREGKDRWMFAGHWLLQTWERYLYAGIVGLARAYVLTGELSYARRSGVLLDRVADLWPDFDFFEQGVMYEEERTSRGYISYWCNTTVQLREMALAYDAVFEALRDDAEFLAFVAEKSERYGTPCRKTSFRDVQKNIELRLLADSMAQPWKVASNYPWPDEFFWTVKMVMANWQDRPEEVGIGVTDALRWTVEEDRDRILANVTKADGLSGEKGLAGYSPIALNETSRLISMFSVHDPETLPKVLKKHPKFLQAFRTYANTWCLTSYFPGCGDTGSLSTPNRGMPFQPGYAAFDAEPSLSAMMYSFEGLIWKLYGATGDANLLRLIAASDNYDMAKVFDASLTLDEPAATLRAKVAEVLKREGTELVQESANLETWKLAVLHSGRGAWRRAAALDGDSGGVHGHNDGMNLSLFARGVNLLPDLGYPPAHRPGGWYSKFFYWYRSAASHNTALVDGREHRDFCWVQRDVGGGQGIISESGHTTLWGIGSRLRAVAIDDPLVPGGVVERFERLIAMVDVGEQDCYWFDTFRVRGGSEHVKLTRASVCALETSGLTLVPFAPEADPYGMGFIRDKNPAENFPYEANPEFPFVRNLRIDRSPSAGWHADWTYLNAYPKYFTDLGDRKVSLRYRDLTDRAEVIAYEAFYDSFGAVQTCYPERLKGQRGHPEEMLPGIAVRSRGTAPLSTTFVGLYEAREGGGPIESARRLPVAERATKKARAGDVAVEVTLAGGVRDLIVSSDTGAGTALVQPDWNVETDAALCLVRRDGTRTLVSAISGTYVRCGKRRAEIDAATGLAEAEL